MLVDANEPLGRSAIIERAGISVSSYDRNIDELAAVGVVESVGNGGHKQWQGWILPWWSPLADVERPRTADGETTLAPPSRWDDILYEIAVALGLDPGYALFASPVDIDKVFAALLALDRWRTFIETHYAPDNEATVTHKADTDTDLRALDCSHTVEIGSPPAGWNREQVTIHVGD